MFRDIVTQGIQCFAENHISFAQEKAKWEDKLIKEINKFEKEIELRVTKREKEISQLKARIAELQEYNQKFVACNTKLNEVLIENERLKEDLEVCEFNANEVDKHRVELIKENEKLRTNIINRMNIMEDASKRNPNLMQTYEVMWKSLKKELIQKARAK